MIPVPDALTPTQRAVRDHLHEGGTANEFVWLLVVLALIIVVAYFATRPKDRAIGGVQRPSPQRFFRSMLTRLGLTTPQRRVLTLVAAELRLTNPAAMLLAPTLFDRYTEQWRSKNQGRNTPDSDTSDDTTVEELRRHLFASQCASHVD